MINRTAALPISVRAQLAGTSLFEGLDDQQWAALEPLFVVKSYAPGATVIAEGDRDPHVYALVEGRAEVSKRTSDGAGVHQLRIFEPGDVVGEMKLAEFQPSSASIVALDRVTALGLDVRDLAQPALITARVRITENLAKLLAARLRSNTAVAVDVMQSELEQSRARVSAGRFMVNVFAIVSVYTLFVAAFTMANPMTRPNQTLVSALAIVIGSLPIWRMIRRSPYPLAAYGLTWQRWRQVLLQSLLYTLPVLALLTALKWIWITLDPRFGAEPLFNPRAIFARDEPFRLGFYVMAVSVYALLSPVQELFNRAGMQASLEKILPSRGGVNWMAIFLSNLFFASAHTYIGLSFALSAFVPGLFWGWLFARQRSLLGVSLSHALVGIWALFVLGVQSLIGGQ